MTPRAIARLAFVAAAGAELIGAQRRFAARQELFAAAQARAHATNRPLVVIGDPHGGAHTRLLPAYGCGDLTLDLTGCPSCPNGLAVDLDRQSVASVAPDSAIVYVSCVLEYVGDPQRAWREILRMAGSPANVFVVAVQPWTATAALYPGARRTVRVEGDRLITAPISTTRKAATLGAVGALAAVALMPEAPAAPRAKSTRA